MFSIPALLRVLYATGMRIGEAVRLTLSDVDLEKGLITIVKSKNQRQRLIPITPSLEEVLKQYIVHRTKMHLRNHLDASAPFFISYTGSKITKGTAYCWFRKILRMAGIPFIGDHRGPRVHVSSHSKFFYLLNISELSILKNVTANDLETSYILFLLQLCNIQRTL